MKITGTHPSCRSGSSKAMNCKTPFFAEFEKRMEDSSTSQVIPRSFDAISLDVLEAGPGLEVRQLTSVLKLRNNKMQQDLTSS